MEDKIVDAFTDSMLRHEYWFNFIVDYAFWHNKLPENYQYTLYLGHEGAD